MSNRPRVADALFESLLYEIVDGVRPPGSQLPAERELAADTGVNRQAVREALQRLRQLGLVEIVHGGGVRVLPWRDTGGIGLLPLILWRSTGPDAEVARSTVELRAAIGADAARSCAARSPVHGLRLLELVREMEELGAEEWNDVRLRFWEEVVVGSGNVAYRLAFNTLREVVMAAAPVLAPVLRSEWEQVDGFRMVAAAVAAGDADRAEAAAHDVLGRGVEAVFRATEGLATASARPALDPVTPAAPAARRSLPDGPGR